MEKKLYKTTFIVEVLSEEPLGDSLSLSDIDYHITDGHCSGVVKTGEEVVITGKEAVKETQSQGTDPSFFMMDEEGNEFEEGEGDFEWNEGDEETFGVGEDDE